MVQQKPHVVIVGAGFGGLRAARALSRAPVRVTLIDRNNYHLFQPLLYQVATAGLSPEEIAHPVRGILRGQKNLEFRMVEVQRVDLASHQLMTSTGSITYDTLILAVGGATNYFGLGALAKVSFGMKGLADATAIRNHLLRQFELADQEVDPEIRKALLTFVVVGGGPTGVESSGAISELIRLVLIKDYPQLKIDEVRVILVEAADHLLVGMPDHLSQVTLETLRRKNVDVRLDMTVSGYDGQQVTFKNGGVIPARTLIWAAGVRAAEVVDGLGVPQGSLHRVVVNPSLQVKGHEEVYVIGDAAYLEATDGVPLPMVAPVAIQQAETAAQNIILQIRGEPVKPFTYHDPGSLATIGRNAAVAQIGPMKFTGWLAWMVWLVVHIMQLIGFRNRLVVLINWVWEYITYERAIRLIHTEKCT